MSRKRVIHIAGPPAAGKTTLGQRIATRYDVFDTDDFLPDTHPVFRLPQDETASVMAWQKAMREVAHGHIRKARRAVVFVGGLRNMRGHLGGWASIADMVDMGIYLEPDAATLLRRYYVRLARLFEHDDDMWRGLADGSYEVDGSETYKQRLREERAHYQRLGYVVCGSAEEALRLANLE
jgi:pantothenate kinase